jgi:hypothetical protein
LSSPVKLNTNASPSTSIFAVQKKVNCAILDLGLGMDNLDPAQSIEKIGFTIQVLHSVGVIFLAFISLFGAFIPGCPFRSAISDGFRLIFENLGTLSKRITFGWFSSKRLRWLWIGALTLLGFAAGTALAVAYNTFSFGAWLNLFFFPAAIPIVFLAQQEVVHKPQKYKVSHLAAWAFLFISLSMSLAISLDLPISIILYITGLLGFIFSCWMFSKMSKSMDDTGEIDAIAWLLITAPPQHPAKFFKKAGQMTGLTSIGRHYRPRLLESLIPLLTQLITSYHAPQVVNLSSDNAHSSSSKPRRNFKNGLKREQSDDVLDGRYGLPGPTGLSLVDDSDDMGPIDEDPHMKNLEIYVACLARLSEFTDNKGSFWCLREDAMQHPKLEQPLIDKLVVFSNPRHHFQDGLRSAATKVLNNYELDVEGKPVTSPATVSESWSFSTVLKRTTALVLNINRLNSHDTEQGYPNLHRPVDPDTRVKQDIRLERLKPER